MINLVDKVLNTKVNTEGAPKELVQEYELMVAIAQAIRNTTKDTTPEETNEV